MKWFDLPAGDELDRYIYEEIGSGPLRRWSTNTDDALNLPLDEGTFFELLVWEYGEYSARVMPRGEEFEVADTAALALCRAWIAYRKLRETWTYSASADSPPSRTARHA